MIEVCWEQTMLRIDGLRVYIESDEPRDPDVRVGCRFYTAVDTGRDRVCPYDLDLVCREFDAVRWVSCESVVRAVAQELEKDVPFSVFAGAAVSRLHDAADLMARMKTEK